MNRKNHAAFAHSILEAVPYSCMRSIGVLQENLSFLHQYLTNLGKIMQPQCN